MITTNPEAAQAWLEGRREDVPVPLYVDGDPVTRSHAYVDRFLRPT